MDTQKTPVVRLLEVTEHLKFIVGANEPAFREFEDHTLKYLTVLNRNIRRLKAEAAKADKVVGKPSK